MSRRASVPTPTNFSSPKRKKHESVVGFSRQESRHLLMPKKGPSFGSFNLDTYLFNRGVELMPKVFDKRALREEKSKVSQDTERRP